MVSIRQVAQMAGVSPATVSRVINGTAKVDEEKAQRVWKVIRETGFTPNEIARSLYKKSSKIIGLITPNIENPFFNMIAKEIEERAYEHGYRLTLCSTNDNDEKEKANIKMLARMNADGIILMTNNEEIREEIETCNMPVVVLDRQLRGSGMSYIQADHYEGGRMATEHLIQCGCKNIVNVKGPQIFSSGRARFKGYQDVCMEHRLIQQCVECDYNYEAGLAAAREILEKYPTTDGVIACNDMVAISIYKVFHKAGIAIPEQVQLIGFDNIHESYLMMPELTTIAQPVRQIGEKAIELIFAGIHQVGGKQEYTFPVQLIQRETTIPPAIKKQS